MSTTFNFKDIIDLPEWRPVALSINSSAAGRGFCHDLRNGERRDPYAYFFESNSTMSLYHKKNDDWIQAQQFATSVSGTFGIGAFCAFSPSQGPTGTVQGTLSSSSFTLQALPNSAQVAPNQLANRGDEEGYFIRVIGSTTGGSGKIEAREIIANTSGATPTILINPPLTFTPLGADKYELLSGRVYLMGAGALTGQHWRAFDVATNTISSGLNTANLATTIGTESAYVMLDECYTPWNRKSGEGFLIGTAVYDTAGTLKGCLQATSCGKTNLVGQAAGGDAGIDANDYARFAQIRIVEDQSTPTAVGQRVIIKAHSAGPSVVYDIGSWGVIPSANAKYTIENNGSLLFWTNAAAVTYSYMAGGYRADSAWTSNAVTGGQSIVVSNPPAAPGAGNVAASCFSITPDPLGSAKHGEVIWFRGANTTTMMILNLAKNTWAQQNFYNNQLAPFTTGTCLAQDVATNSGNYAYINVSATQRMVRMDIKNKTIEPYGYFPYTQGAAVIGQRLFMSTYMDGNDKISYVNMLRASGIELFNMAIQR